MLTDAELLRRYVKDRAEPAFAELVRRHLNLVYAAALRRTGGRHALAEEIAQTVFTGLARQAVRLTSHPTLVGWLYRSTRNAAVDAIRSEQRREKLAQTLTTMPEELSPAECPPEWEQLRPVIDEAMDQLKEQDREIMLLRFFQGLPFGEIGAKLNLTENNARMRSARAVEKLRSRLGERGITSTVTLLALLANESLVAAPAGLAVRVSAVALAAAPSASLVGFLTRFLFHKVTAASLSAAVAAGLTGLVWATLSNDMSDAALAALRLENARLAASLLPPEERAAQTTAIVHAVERRLQEKTTAELGKHRNHGVATPRDAFLTYVWAIDSGDAAALRKILRYDDEGKGAIRAIYARMPASIRGQYLTPEDLMVFFFLADSLLSPAPDAEVIEKFRAIETTPGHAVLRPPGAEHGGMEWIQTPDGWKVIVPGSQCERLSQRILGNEMLAKLGIR